MNLVATDFFCGAGGVTCGFNQANIKVLGGVDNDQTCKQTYEINNDGAKFIKADISELGFDNLKAELDIKCNDDNLIFVGCSPCQYYTNMKTDKRRSAETRMLLEDFQEFVDHFRPGFIFIENVPGLEKDVYSPLVNFKSFLHENGYNFDDGVVNAKHFGVPQNRRRYILIASRINTSVKLPKGDKNNYISVKTAIGDFKVYPPIPAGHTDPTDYIHSAARLSELNLERIRNTRIDGGDRREWANNPALQLKCYQNHSGHYDVYGRMKWSDVSPTITTRFRSLSNGRYGHPVQDRAISLREGATLQSFPEDYKFIATNQDKIAKMIGNAVPPRLAKEIGNYITSLATNRDK